jgi:hypothetical protein
MQCECVPDERRRGWLACHWAIGGGTTGIRPLAAPGAVPQVAPAASESLPACRGPGAGPWHGGRSRVDQKPRDPAKGDPTGRMPPPVCPFRQIPPGFFKKSKLDRQRHSRAIELSRCHPGRQWQPALGASEAASGSGGGAGGCPVRADPAAKPSWRCTVAS